MLDALGVLLYIAALLVGLGVLFLLLAVPRGGGTYRAGEPTPGEWTPPPAHPQCRCVVTPAPNPGPGIFLLPAKMDARCTPRDVEAVPVAPASRNVTDEER